MKIKKLEMVGFKSFVDRTVVHFDHDVLGIVGPNGCGKSNIVDAIRWCMGEQSAKHLRGRSMEDVIFSGSETRAGHDFAEVTLTFENNGNDAPLEYRDYPEIAVTRRLQRDGDSDYLINKTPVRLKDITDLFLGTGAGTKAYAIVEQGKIGLIVSAKPEDRRLLIEEAAGITKFKSKKKQAEKKMELTQQNLLRVGDILTEIDRSIGSLKRQAAKAERFVSYRKELEDLQLHEASHRYLELTGWLKLEQAEVERCAVEAEGAKASLVAREAELETLRLGAHVAEDALEKAQTASFGAENEVRAEEAAVERARDKLAALKAREAQAERELHELAQQKERLAGEREAVGAEVVSLEDEEGRFADVVAEEEARLAEVSGEQSRADGAAAEMRRERAKAQADIASAEAKLTGFDRRRGDMRGRVEKLRGEREDLEGANYEHAATATELGESIAELRSGKTASVEEKARIEAQLAELRTSVVVSERALDEAKGELGKKRSRLQALVEVQRRLEGVGAGTKALVAMGDPGVCGLVADRIEAPPELTQALAGLLGARLQDVVVRDVAVGLDLLAQLGEERRGRATIVALEGRPAFDLLPAPEGSDRLFESLRFAAEDEGLVRLMVGDALVVAGRDDAQAIHRATPGVTVVTLDGTVFHADGRVSGGQGEELAAGMLESKRETRELGLEVLRLDALTSARLAEHQALRDGIQGAQSALDRARQDAHQREVALVGAEKDSSKAQAQLETVRRRLEVIAAEQEDLAAELADAEGERAGAQSVLDDARATLERVDAMLGAAEATASSWREQVDARRQIVTERKVRMAGTRERLSGARGTLTRLSRSTDELSQRAVRLDDELMSGARAWGEAAAQVVIHREKREGALDRAKIAAAALGEARAAFETLRGDLGEREAVLKDLRKRDHEAGAELTRHEMELRERRLAMQHLLEGVAEKFRGLRLARVVGDYHMRPQPDDESRARIQELAQLLERMGSVNLDAVREHAESVKRQDFYSSQKADLDKALSDLERAIQQMNRESKRLFAETFEAVNAKFKELFPRMFRGGAASLRLTNPEDMLETGIDILAQPPGKKLSSIELMSGGEKALTAVALIFSIFQIKPSPFCILDEVDAPLDEANVARYNEAIRGMTDRSQFILITHIKRTMQLVDVLYGVTMPEPGVSKIVSVKLAETVEKRKPLAAEPTAQVA